MYFLSPSMSSGSASFNFPKSEESECEYILPVCLYKIASQLATPLIVPMSSKVSHSCLTGIIPPLVSTAVMPHLGEPLHRRGEPAGTVGLSRHL